MISLGYYQLPSHFVTFCSNSPSGEATLRFVSNKANHILASIRRCINVAMAMRQHTRPSTSDPRNRTESVLTVSAYQALLDRSPRAEHTGAEVGGEGVLPGDIKVKSRSSRTGSGSSASTMTPASPTSSAGDLGLSADNVSADFDEEGVVVPRRHRVSVNSLAGSLSSSSPKASDIFGSDLQHQQELRMQQWQLQQATTLQQQQQQQQRLHGSSPQPWAQQQQLQQVQQWHQQQAVPLDHQWTQQQQLQQQQQQHAQQLHQPEMQTLLKDRVGITRNSSVPNGISMATEDKGHSIISTEGEDFVAPVFSICLFSFSCLCCSSCP